MVLQRQHARPADSIRVVFNGNCGDDPFNSIRGKDSILLKFIKTML